MVLTIGTIFYFTSKHHETHLNSLYVSADSIIWAQVRDLENHNGIPSSENISEFREAIVLLDKVLKDSPDSYSKKAVANMKVGTINELIDIIEEYDYTNRLVENAQITEMKDSVIKYSLKRENQIIKISNLIQQLK